MGFFLDFSDGTLYWGLVFVNLTLGEVQFSDDFISWVQVNAKEHLVKGLVENDTTIAGNPGLIIEPEIVLKLHQLR